MSLGDSNAVDLARRVSLVRGPGDLAEILEELAYLHESGKLQWENSDLVSFLNGMSLAVRVFESERLGSYQDILDKGTWRTMAEIIAIGLVID